MNATPFASSAAIADAVARIAAEIDRDHPGEPPILVGVLNGSLPFLADLARACETDVEIDLLSISQFGIQAKQGGIVRIVKDLDSDIQGRPVVLVEDIVDTGSTLSYLLRMLRARGPASLRVAALLDRRAHRGDANAQVDYAGLEAPDGFLVGYGLDADGLFRNLRSLWLLDHPASISPEEIAALHALDAAG